MYNKYKPEKVRPSFKKALWDYTKFLINLISYTTTIITFSLLGYLWYHKSIGTW